MVDKAQSQSSPIVWVALVLTLAAVAWTAMQESEVEDVDLVQETRPVTTAREISDSQADSLLENEEKVAVKQNAYAWQQIDRDADHQRIKDIFAPKSWVVKPKVVARNTQPAPPPAPTAPPLPFTYMGKLDQGADGVQVFLMQNDKVLTVRVGDKVNRQWRLDHESESMLTFTFMPLEQQAQLSKSASRRRPVPPTANGRIPAFNGRSRMQNARF